MQMQDPKNLCRIGLIVIFVLIDCSSVAGTYENGGVSIDFKSNQLHGQFHNGDRPDFTGTISDNCKGTMDFPDERTMSFEYDEEQYMIFWDNKETGDVWNKGNNC